MYVAERPEPIHGHADHNEVGGGDEGVPGRVEEHPDIDGLGPVVGKVHLLNENEKYKRTVTKNSTNEQLQRTVKKKEWKVQEKSYKEK